MKQIPENIASYLRDFSSDKWSIELCDDRLFDNVIVIPAIAESENIKELLVCLSGNDNSYLEKTLVLFVINNPKSSPEPVKEDNKRSIGFLRNLIYKTSDANYKTITDSGMHIGLIDASSDEKATDDKSGGVGLARKIGMDLALTVFNYNSPAKKIIISLDADCKVEKNYLSVITEAFNNQNLSAATVEFAHDIPCSNSAAHNTLAGFKSIIYYESYLRYYVLGHHYAHSPFAYHTIGSTIACDHQAYIKAGGMNKLKAAEDFYFLQKLAKVFNIHKINGTVVKPSARESWRVPFGTGKSMLKFRLTENDYNLYNPDIFRIIKDWLELFSSDSAQNTEEILSYSGSIHPELYNFLLSKKFPLMWEKILKSSRTEKQLIYQRKNWFDAFATLKLIHHLRDTAFPNINFADAVYKLLDMLYTESKIDFKQADPMLAPAKNNNANDDAALMHKYLQELREAERWYTDNISISASVEFTGNNKN